MVVTLPNWLYTTLIMTKTITKVQFFNSIFNVVYNYGGGGGGGGGGIFLGWGNSRFPTPFYETIKILSRGGQDQLKGGPPVPLPQNAPLVRYYGTLSWNAFSNPYNVNYNYPTVLILAMASV